MHQPDIEEHHPGQARRGQQQKRRQPFGNGGARRRRLGRAVIVMAMLVMRFMDRAARGRNVMMAVVVAVHHAAGIARTRTGERDQAREDRAEQRQEDDGLQHA